MRLVDSPGAFLSRKAIAVSPVLSALCWQFFCALGIPPCAHWFSKGSLLGMSAMLEGRASRPSLNIYRVSLPHFSLSFCSGWIHLARLIFRITLMAQYAYAVLLSLHWCVVHCIVIVLVTYRYGNGSRTDKAFGTPAMPPILGSLRFCTSNFRAGVPGPATVDAEGGGRSELLGDAIPAPAA